MNEKLKYWAGRAFMATLVALFVVAFAYTLPFDFALLAAIDMAIYADAFIGVYLIARVTRVGPAMAYYRLRLATLLGRFAKRARRPSIRSDKSRNSAANHDHPAVAMAAKPACRRR